MEQFDVAMIGKGPAGISAALYTTRANLKTLVIGSDTSSLKKADRIENYFGFAQPVSGEALLAAGIEQARRVGAVIAQGEVTALTQESGFVIKTPEDTFRAKAVLIATGQPARRPDIPGLREYEGRGVSYCTTCDGFFYRNKKVGVLGNGDYAVEEAAELLPFTKDITLFTNGAELSVSPAYAQAAAQYTVVKTPVNGVTGEKALSEIILAGNGEPIDGLFVAMGTAGSTDFALKLGVLLKDNAIVVDEKQRTNLEGVFAAGDCTGGFRQISTAVGQGAMAGRSIIEYVRGHRAPSAAPY